MQHRILRKSLAVGIVSILLISVYIPSNGYAQEISRRKNDSNVYYSYDQLSSLLEYLQLKYPEIFLYSSLGKTYGGRNLWLVKISDNVTIDEDEPAILYTGGIHGNENPGYQVVIYSLKAIVENYTRAYVNESFTNRIKSIVNTTELYFIPMVNPDGIEANVRKNRQPNNCTFGGTLFRGVDLNRNFDYNWDDVFKHPFRYIIIPRTLDELKYVISSKTIHLFERSTIIFPFLDWGSLFRLGCYRGPDPFSENETKAVKRFIDNHTITSSVSYHIYSEVIGYPQVWDNYTSDSDKAIFFSIAQNISQINGYKFDTEKKLKRANSSGLLENWAYITHNIFAFIIELCDSNKCIIFPDKAEILNLCNTHLLVNLYLAERVHTISD
jgi:carboxypeptidase T